MRKRGRALTLSEVLVAMALAAMAVVAVSALIGSVYRAVSEGKYQASASTLARQEIERLRGDRQERRRMLTASPETSAHVLSVGDSTHPFNATVEVRPLAAMANRYVEAHCTVIWDQDNQRRQIDLKTTLPHPDQE